ncbi:hypothetical protein RFI_11693, partial [Reticulomyxa filosa]
MPKKAKKKAVKKKSKSSTKTVDTVEETQVSNLTMLKENCLITVDENVDCKATYCGGIHLKEYKYSLANEQSSSYHRLVFHGQQCGIDNAILSTIVIPSLQMELLKILFLREQQTMELCVVAELYLSGNGLSKPGLEDLVRHFLIPFAP